MPRLCIICEKEVFEGYKVKESPILDFIKQIKGKLKILKNNELYVCVNCLEEYKKRKKKFNNSLLLNSIVGVLLLFALVILPLIFSQEFRLDGFFVMLFLVGFLFVLSLFSYIPDIEEQKQTFSQVSPDSSSPNLLTQPNLNQEQGNLTQTSLVVASSQPPLQPLELSQKTEQIKQDISNAILSASLSAQKIKKKKKLKKKKSKFQKSAKTKKTKKAKINKKFKKPKKALKSRR